MSLPGWIERIGDFNVERQEGPRPGGQAFLRLSETRTHRVIWHTTEGFTVDGAVATLRANFSCPHFVIGQGRIVQMRPLWAEAATVRGDNSIAWQVEVVGKSQTHLWLPEPGSLNPMVALLRFFRDSLGVPLRRPDGWRDDGSDIEGIWATESNSRRRSGRATTFVGHVMHLEWPENTHWNQGAINWSRIFNLVEDEMTDEERAKLERALEKALEANKRSSAVAAAVEDFINGDTPPPDSHLVRRRTFKALRRAAQQPVPTDPGTHRHDDDYVAKGTTVTIP